MNFGDFESNEGTPLTQEQREFMNDAIEHSGLTVDLKQKLWDIVKMMELDTDGCNYLLTVIKGWVDVDDHVIYFGIKSVENLVKRCINGRRPFVEEVIDQLRTAGRAIAQIRYKKPRWGKEDSARVQDYLAGLIRDSLDSDFFLGDRKKHHPIPTGLSEREDGSVKPLQCVGCPEDGQCEDEIDLTSELVAKQKKRRSDLDRAVNMKRAFTDLVSQMEGRDTEFFHREDIQEFKTALEQYLLGVANESKKSFFDMILPKEEENT